MGIERLNLTPYLWVDATQSVPCTPYTPLSVMRRSKKKITSCIVCSKAKENTLCPQLETNWRYVISIAFVRYIGMHVSMFSPLHIRRAYPHTVCESSIHAWHFVSVWCSSLHHKAEEMTRSFLPTQLHATPSVLHHMNRVMHPESRWCDLSDSTEPAC